PKGVYNVVGPGEVPLSAVLRELGHTAIPVPHPLARSALNLLFKYRIASFPPPELDHIQYLCAVDGSRWVKDVGWKPSYSMRDTIRSVISDARPG
ncbi:MAG TPA: NAD-dependent epimerase, partial [Myxococcales bacterium]|nr:NAD-dependent epimerase [Myxococcales bacterium]